MYINPVGFYDPIIYSNYANEWIASYVPVTGTPFGRHMSLLERTANYILSHATLLIVHFKIYPIWNAMLVEEGMGHLQGIPQHDQMVRACARASVCVRLLWGRGVRTWLHVRGMQRCLLSCWVLRDLHITLCSTPLHTHTHTHTHSHSLTHSLPHTHTIHARFP